MTDSNVVVSNKRPRLSNDELLSDTSSGEKYRSKLDCENKLHELNCFASDLYSNSCPSSKCPSFRTFADPAVNLAIDALININKKNDKHGSINDDLSTQDIIILKLSTEVDELRKSICVSSTSGQIIRKKVTRSTTIKNLLLCIISNMIIHNYTTTLTH